VVELQVIPAAASHALSLITGSDSDLRRLRNVSAPLGGNRESCKVYYAVPLPAALVTASDPIYESLLLHRI